MPSLTELHNIDDLRSAAKRRLPGLVFDYIDGGAEDETTLRRNRSAFQDIGLNPEILRGVGTRSLATTLFGTTLASPIGVSPTGGNRLVHPDGELAVARATGKRGALNVVGMFSNFTLEEIAAVSDGPKWLQLYLWKDRGLLDSVVERARAAGYAAICVTADTAVFGKRERDLRNGLRVPPKVSIRTAVNVLRRPRWLAHYLRTRDQVTMANLRDVPGATGKSGPQVIAFAHELFDPDESWADIDRLREQWDGPLLVKGITHPNDARRAVAAGADGIMVSNHGGRQLDGAPAAIEAMARVVDAVGGEAEVLIDGGIRRGTDAAKALSIGASACLVGRPFWYGLSIAGEAGVDRALDILDDELDRTIALLGVRSPAELGPGHVRMPSSWHDAPARPAALDGAIAAEPTPSTGGA
jgi:L-lactate dehydrogenase (cytochrome)